MIRNNSINEQIVFLRAVAILIVMTGHSIILYDPSWSLYTTHTEAPLFTILKKIINVVQMPLFFSVSGYLFYYSINKRGLLQLCLQKSKRLLIPYLCIALLWMNPLKMALNVPGYNVHEIATLLKGEFFLTNNGHLWFLPCLFFIFIGTYFLNKIIDKDWILTIILLAASIFHNKLPGIFEINQTAMYSIFFYCGFLANKYKSGG